MMRACSSLRKGSSRGVAAVMLAVALAACGNDDAAAPASGPPGEQIRSTKPRLTAAAPAADVSQLTADNASFALDVLAKKAGPDNLVASPHSISIALAMTYAGARAQTATQMAQALRFTLPADRLHAAFGTVDLALADRATKPVESGKAFALHVTSSLWGQRGYRFLTPFLDTLAEHYGAGLSLLDFASDPEGSRTKINGWVSDRTAAKIPELLPPGVIGAQTVLVLTNAIYFNASWLHPFEEAATKKGEFTKLDGSTTSVSLMTQSKEHRYAEGDGWQALELAYVGEDVSMLFVLPAAGRFEDVRAGLDGAKLSSIVGALGNKLVDVTVPRFQMRTQLPTKEVLQSLGMSDAFQGGVADFSGMDGSRGLFIQDVIHEAFVAVDERGTEAAAATAVVVGRTALPERATFTATRPFFVFVRDNPTGAVLFVGRVTSP